jgi:hypothetical protein
MMINRRINNNQNNQQCNMAVQGSQAQVDCPLVGDEPLLDGPLELVLLVVGLGDGVGFV